MQKIIKPASLEGLPAELKNKIYEYYFNDISDETKSWPNELASLNHDRRRCFTTPKGWQSYTAVQPALTRVSAKIWAETLPMFYGSVPLFATYSRAPARQLRSQPKYDLTLADAFMSHLRAIGPENCRNMRRMYLDLGPHTAEDVLMAYQSYVDVATRSRMPTMRCLDIEKRASL